jgi:hypothetical protein
MALSKEFTIGQLTHGLRRSIEHVVVPAPSEGSQGWPRCDTAGKQ